jgi:magnesium transporter
MHLPELDAVDDLNVGEVSVFVGKNYVLSVRNRSRQSLLGVRSRCEREPELLRQGAGFVLYALMDAVVDRYFPLIDALESELEAVEAQIFVKDAARANIKRMYALKRHAMSLKHAVAPLMDAVSKLQGAGCRRSAPRARNIFVTFMTICCATTRRSIRSATPLPRRSR